MLRRYVQHAWQETFLTFPPSCLTIYRSRNKFNKTSLVSNAPKSGGSKTATTEENKMLVAVIFTNSPKILHNVLC